MERNSSKKWNFTELAQPLWSLWRPLHCTLGSFLFRGIVRNGIPRVCFYFCSTERNSELFSLPRKGSEGNSESFLFRKTAGIPLGKKHLFPLFRLPRNYFLSEIPNSISIIDTKCFNAFVKGHCKNSGWGSDELRQSQMGWLFSLLLHCLLKEVLRREN